MSQVQGYRHPYLTEAELANFEKGGMGRRSGFGDRPAVVVVDLTRAFVEDAFPLGNSQHGQPCVAATARLAGVFQVEDSLRYRPWIVDEQKMALVVQVVLAAFIHDTHEIILGGPRIRNDPVDLAWNERRLVIGVVDTQSKWLCRLFHFSSKYLLIFKSRFLIP